MTKPKAKTATSKYDVVFQDGFHRIFEAENEGLAAVKASKWAKVPANGRNGKTIILKVYKI